MRLVEVVISPESPLVGHSIRDAEIRTRYGAVVVAVHRLGARLPGRLGDVVLRPGDTLLLEALPGFARRHRQSKSFYLVSEVAGTAAPRHERAWLSVAILIGLIVTMSCADLPVIRDLPIVGGMPEVTAAMCAALAMILFRCCTGAQARAAIEWHVLVVIGASFGLGKAMEASGLSPFIARETMALAEPWGTWGLLGVLYAMTLLFTMLISNNAAAALVFPIAASIARSGEFSFTPFAVTICLAASLEFTTPLGYQTNLMVMGPGGYRWIDYVRFGGPLTLLTAVISIILIPLVFPLF
jgi:di/tricarboxylate transporter